MQSDYHLVCGSSLLTQTAIMNVRNSTKYDGLKAEWKLNLFASVSLLLAAHDCCEVVLVTLCSATQATSGDSEDPASGPGCVAPLAEHQFHFVQDLAFDMAQFLVSTAGRADGLDGALLLDECQIPLQECERLDESLALALHHLVLPPGWSLLGSNQASST
ncbi:hypothetical protein ATANTOWER_017216, partial [Ataeniobius toweri]|nr:hypothetical protein [Ataeniobius toweri]